MEMQEKNIGVIYFSLSFITAASLETSISLK